MILVYNYNKLLIEIKVGSQVGTYRLLLIIVAHSFFILCNYLLLNKDLTRPLL